MTHKKVSDVMTTSVVSVRGDVPFRDIAQTLATHHISAVPVVDRDDRVTGVVSQTDLLHKLETTGAGQESIIRRLTHRTQLRKAEGRTAADVMTSPAVTVPAGTSVVTAAKVMEGSRNKRLPVVDDLGRLIGIVSQSDLLKVFLRPDEEVREEIVKDVFLRQLWVQPTEVTVTVTHGVVELRGQLEQSSLIDLALDLVRDVDGVVDVIDKLTFRTDDRLAAPSAEYYRPLV